MIEGGYYIKARRIQESEIAHAPPHVREIWDWLLLQANHKDNGKFKRGQCLRSYRDIQEGLHWMVGWRKMTYSKWDCEEAMKKLRSLGNITTRKTTRGLIIQIVKYDYYQNPSNYEHHNGDHNEHHNAPQSRHTINKNEKNEKKKQQLATKIVALSLPEAIKKLEDSPRRDLNIIALFFEHRKPDLRTNQQFRIAVKRHLRAASQLVSFADEQILKALREAKREYGDKYTLETLVKLLTK